ATGRGDRAIDARARLRRTVAIATVATLSESGLHDLIETVFRTRSIGDREAAVATLFGQAEEARARVGLLEPLFEQRLGLGLTQAGTRRQWQSAHDDRRRERALW